MPCYQILRRNMLLNCYSSVVMLPPCRHKPPLRADDLPRLVLCFLIDLRVCFEMYWIVFQLIPKNLYKLCWLYVSCLSDYETPLNFTAWGLFCASKKASWCPSKHFSVMQCTLKGKKCLHQTLHFALGVSSSSQIVIMNRSISSSSWLGLAQFLSAWPVSARRVVRTRL